MHATAADPVASGLMTLSSAPPIVGDDPDCESSPLLLRLTAGTLLSLPVPSASAPGSNPAATERSEDDAR